MSARLYIAADQLTGDQVTLQGDGHRHLTKVLRARVGDPIGVFDGKGDEIDGRIEAIDKRATTIRLGQRRHIASPPAQITLLQVLPRPDRMDLIVQKTTELGVTRIVPVLTDRSPMAGKETSGKLERWATIAREAARQCGRADVPKVDPALDLTHAAQQWRPEPNAVALVLWETDTGNAMSDSVPGGARDVRLLVGPEGGLSEQDVTQVQQHGFACVGLGPRILRTETAAIVAVALAQSATGGLR